MPEENINLKVVIKDRLNNVFNYLGVNLSEGLFEEILKCYSKKRGESNLIKTLSEIHFYDFVQKKEIEFSKRKFDTIYRYIDGDYILDLGAGNGKLAETIKKELNKNITLVDVTDFNKTNIPLILYDGKNLPIIRDYFDTSLLIVVLHHCIDSLSVLKEAIRVTKKRIIIIEAIYSSNEEKEVNKFFYWFSNRILLKRKIEVPFNYKSSEEWTTIFKQFNLSIIIDKDLGWNHQPLAPEHRKLYVLDKIEGRRI